MKKIYKFLLIAIVSSSSIFYSCDSLELEQLTSPNALSPDLSDPDLLLNSIQLAYRLNQRSFQENSAELSRIEYQNGRNYLATYDDGTFNGVWNRLYSNNGTGDVSDSYYLGMIPNTNAIASIAAENPDPTTKFLIINKS